MNILFTVCARAGSKGVKNKNIKEFLGHPLIYYTLSAIDLFKKNNILKYDNIDICVSSDSLDIIKKSKQFMDIYEINRAEELSGDYVSKVLVIKDSLNKMEKINNIEYDFVIDLDITSPLRTVEDIEIIINKKIKNRQLDVVFSVVESRRSPYFNMVESNGENLVKKIIDFNAVARQQVPKTYDMNASIYTYEVGFLKLNTTKNVFDGNSGIIEMMDTGILDIDSENDFKLMSIIAKYLFSSNKKFKDIEDNIEERKI